MDNLDDIMVTLVGEVASESMTRTTDEGVVTILKVKVGQGEDTRLEWVRTEGELARYASQAGLHKADPVVVVGVLGRRTVTDRLGVERTCYHTLARHLCLDKSARWLASHAS